MRLRSGATTKPVDGKATKTKSVRRKRTRTKTASEGKIDLSDSLERLTSDQIQQLSAIKKRSTR